MLVWPLKGGDIDSISLNVYRANQTAQHLYQKKDLKSFKWFEAPVRKYIMKRGDRSKQSQKSMLAAMMNLEINPSKGLYMNERYQCLKTKEYQALLSSKGRQIFAKRKIDMKSVFGQIKGLFGL